jgi:hypothetical protein
MALAASQPGSAFVREGTVRVALGDKRRAPAEPRGHLAKRFSTLEAYGRADGSGPAPAFEFALQLFEGFPLAFGCQLGLLRPRGRIGQPEQIGV